jgi:hypothetical protein
MSQIVYYLSQTEDFGKLVFTNDPTDLITNLNKTECTTANNQKYQVIRYNKHILCYDNIPTYGVYRSVIVNSDNKVICFSPPKSVSSDSFIKTYNTKTESLIAEEFVEGTMINVFWDSNIGLSGAWEISTRNTVGADSSFYKSPNSKTFRTMFLEAAANNNLDLDSLHKNFCYSFVLQHPENRIVVPFKMPQLYLISMYIVDNSNQNNIKVYSVDKSHFLNLHMNTTVKIPTVYDWNTYSDLIDKYASMNTSYDILGVVIHNNETGERTKIRNPVYEEVRQLRGNQPKLQYQYLCLRKEGKVGDFLKYFPENKKDFSSFRDQIHLFTNTLFGNYISCYIKKEKPLIDFPNQYRTHMFNIHKHYLNELKEQKLYVTNTVVIKYVNNIHPSLLMFCLNFQMRKRNVDLIKADSNMDVSVDVNA